MLNSFNEYIENYLFCLYIAILLLEVYVFMSANKFYTQDSLYLHLIELYYYYSISEFVL